MSFMRVYTGPKTDVYIADNQCVRKRRRLKKLKRRFSKIISLIILLISLIIFEANIAATFYLYIYLLRQTQYSLRCLI